MSRPTRVPKMSFILKGLSPALATLSSVFRLLILSNWSVPRSLVTTNGISFDFFSFGYLDISVHRVRLIYLCIQYIILLMQWVSPFGNPRIKGYSHLHGAYRNVLRPSSPPKAKTSPGCPSYFNYLISMLYAKLDLHFTIY